VKAPTLTREREPVREVVTPEGVPIHLPLATVGDRFGALLYDLFLIALLVGGFTLMTWVLTLPARGSADVVSAAALLAAFLVRTFYFTFFELAFRGQTPGKRRFRLRVVDAGGGPLAPEALIARNLTRELELFMPAMAIAMAQSLFPGAPGWMRLAAVGWMLVFGLLPLVWRQRLRVGDLIAGTVVIRTPGVMLLDELVHAPAAAAGELRFSLEQLGVYGEYELQVLEQLLRGIHSSTQPEKLREVAEKIRAKIGWTGPLGDHETFLREFYAALRAHLERRLLLGRRRLDKHG
jgi:uncharacterized RDD family membrane protein YckC